MHKLYDIFMPADMRAELLDSLIDLKSKNAGNMLSICSDWFAATVQVLTSDQDGRVISPSTEYGGTYTITGGIEGSAFSSGLHIDGKDIGYSHPNAERQKFPYATKYVLTVANNQRAGTMFFENMMKRNGEYGLVEARTENLYQRSEGGGLVYRDGIVIPCTQPLNGQLAGFDIFSQPHAAAPQYNGDVKVLFAYQSVLPNLPELLLAA